MTGFWLWAFAAVMAAVGAMLCIVLEGLLHRKVPIGLIQSRLAERADVQVDDVSRVLRELRKEPRWMWSLLLHWRY